MRPITIIHAILIESAMSLDGQSDPMSDSEAESLYNDPQCARNNTSLRSQIDWTNIRYLPLIDFAGNVLNSEVFRNSWDEIARDCLFGMITLFYWASLQSLLAQDLMYYENE